MSSIGSVKSEVILQKYRTPTPTNINRRQSNSSVSRIPSRTSVAITKTHSSKRQQLDVGDGSKRRYTSSTEKMASVHVVHNAPENSPECCALGNGEDLSKICRFMNICQERSWSANVRTRGHRLLTSLCLFFEAIAIFVIYALFGDAVIDVGRRFISDRSSNDDAMYAEDELRPSKLMNSAIMAIFHPQNSTTLIETGRTHGVFEFLKQALLRLFGFVETWIELE